MPSRQVCTKFLFNNFFFFWWGEIVLKIVSLYIESYVEIKALCFYEKNVRRIAYWN